jgi:hypothetical protein
MTLSKLDRVPQSRWRKHSRSGTKVHHKQALGEIPDPGFFDVLQGRNRQDSRADTEQGPGEVELTDNVQNLSIDSGQIQASGITESEKTRLLLCIDDGRSKSILKQEVLENIKSDFELFDYLHKQYFTNYQWFTVRSIGMVSLAHVSLLRTYEASLASSSVPCLR